MRCGAFASTAMGKNTLLIVELGFATGIPFTLARGRGHTLNEPPACQRQGQRWDWGRGRWSLVLHPNRPCQSDIRDLLSRISV